MKTIALWLILVALVGICIEIERTRHDFERAHHLPDIALGLGA